MSNINYTYTCQLCRLQAVRGRVEGEDVLSDQPVGRTPVVAQYRGETSRSLYVRNREHIQAYTRNDQSGFMWNHVSANHQADMNSLPGEIFKVEISGRDKDPLRRILREAIKIRSVLDGEVLEITENTENGELKVNAKLELLNSKREWFLPTVISLGVTEL